LDYYSKKYGARPIHCIISFRPSSRSVIIVAIISLLTVILSAPPVKSDRVFTFLVQTDSSRVCSFTRPKPFAAHPCAPLSRYAFPCLNVHVNTVDCRGRRQHPRSVHPVRLQSNILPFGIAFRRRRWRINTEIS